MVKNYQELKEWRAKKPTYNKNYMKKKRRQYRRAWKDGIIPYEDIPKSYRTWTNKKTSRGAGKRN